jgi:hypothetical protein
MAAVTVVRRRNIVLGSKRALLLNVNANATGDTFDPQQVMRSVDVALADGSTSTVVNTTFTAGTKGPIAFTFSGGIPIANIDVLIIGN